MVDVPQAQVRVLPNRLKKSLKKTISKIDREIQVIDDDYKRSKVNAEYASGNLAKRWRDRAVMLLQKRQKLDEKRKQARLRLKGVI